MTGASGSTAGGRYHVEGRTVVGVVGSHSLICNGSHSYYIGQVGRIIYAAFESISGCKYYDTAFSVPAVGRGIIDGFRKYRVADDAGGVSP